MVALLRNGELTVDGRLVVASNVTLLGRVSAGPDSLRCVYKPVGGERPLWDFPDGSLAAREVAAYELSEAAGWRVVPPTVLRLDGPLGRGMCQAWIEQDGSVPGLVDVVPPDAVADGWFPILEAVDGDGAPVVLVHADDAALRRLALFDAVINNADRKGGHVLTGGEHMAPIVGVDHGVSFHVEPKLRTVLWGWAGQRISDSERADLAHLRTSLDGGLGSRLAGLLTPDEVVATTARVDDLLRRAEMPRPKGRMPVPWPVF